MFLRSLNTVGVSGVVAINILANALPMNGRTTGEISNKYENLFTPADYTFGIWIPIYLGLIAFCCFQFGIVKQASSEIEDQSKELTSTLGYTFILSCFANALWLICWHFQLLLLSIVCMLVLLIMLFVINKRINALMHDGRPKNLFKWMVSIPLGFYLGWICVATIANILVYLTAHNYGVFMSNELLWVLCLIITAGVSGLYLMRQLKLTSAAGAICWGLLGIFFKHRLDNQQYAIQIVSITTIILLLVGVARTIRRQSKPTIK